MGLLAFSIGLWVVFLVVPATVAVAKAEVVERPGVCFAEEASAYLLSGSEYRHPGRPVSMERGPPRRPDQ